MRDVEHVGVVASARTCDRESREVGRSSRRGRIFCGWSFRMGLQVLPGGVEDFAGGGVGEAIAGARIGEPFKCGVFVGEGHVFLRGFADEEGDGLADGAFFWRAEKVANLFFEIADAADLADAGFLLKFPHGRLPCGFVFFEVALGVIPMLAVIEQQEKRFRGIGGGEAAE